MDILSSSVPSTNILFKFLFIFYEFVVDFVTRVGAIALPLIGLALLFGSLYFLAFIRLMNAISPPKILTNESAKDVHLLVQFFLEHFFFRESYGLTSSSVNF